jgi:hypothetical protein
LAKWSLKRRQGDENLSLKTKQLFLFYFTIKGWNLEALFFLNNALSLRLRHLNNELEPFNDCFVLLCEILSLSLSITFAFLFLPLLDYARLEHYKLLDTRNTNYNGYSSRAIGSLPSFDILEKMETNEIWKMGFFLFVSTFFFDLK